MLSGVAFGLIAAACWGFSDFLARFSSRSVGAFRALYLSQFGGLAVLALGLPFGGWPSLPAGVGWMVWAWAVGCALLVTLGALAFFQAFGKGALAVVAPIVGSYGAVTALLAVLNGEALRPPVALGLLVVLLGIVLSSIPPRPTAREARPPSTGRFAPGVAWALLSAGILGVTFFLLGAEVTPRLGGFTPTWLFRLVGLLVLAGAARPAGQSLRWPAGRAWLLPTLVGALSTLAVLATNLGLGHGQDAPVTVLGSLSTVITTLLALVVLREALGALQWWGAALACAGVILIGL